MNVTQRENKWGEFEGSLFDKYNCNMIQDVIASVVKDLHRVDNMQFTFFNGERDIANVQVDRLQLPMAYLDDMIQISYIIRQNSRIESVYSCLMMFLSKSSLKDLPEDRKPAIYAMQLASKEFILKLIQSPYTLSTTSEPPVKNIKANPVYNYFDANLDGIVLTFDVELSELGFSYCHAFEPQVAAGGDFDHKDYNEPDFH